MLRQFGVGHRLHRRMFGEEFDHFARVLHMPRHPQRQGFDALQNLERGERVHRRAEVAQAFAPRAQAERSDGAFFGEHHAMKAVVRLGQLGKFARGDPVKSAAIDQQAANHRTVAGEKLGCRVVDQIRAVIQRFQEVRRGEGRIDEERNLVLVRELAQHRQVQHIEAGIAEGFAIEHFGIRADRRTPGIDVARVNEAGIDAKAAQRVVEQIMRAAVKCARSDDVRPGPGNRCQPQMQCGLAARGGQTGHAAFERGDALFEHGSGRVGNARIHMARTLHVEQARRVIRILEHEGRGEVNRRRARAGFRVGGSAGMQGERVKAGVFWCRHGVGREEGQKIMVARAKMPTHAVSA